MHFGSGFTALIDRFHSNPGDPIALAVSGGSDSLALLHVVKAWSDRTQRKLIAFTVNHGLRSEAASEAKTVTDICDRLGVEHQILLWREPHATQNAARRARYRLIGTAMRAVGARCLLTGHTRDDVVETMMIRRRHGVRDAMAVGPALAAPLPVWPEGFGITVIRPLLESRRCDLRRYLDGLQCRWIEDPSNADPKFERVRIRQFFRRHPQLLVEAFAAAQRLAIERSRLDSDFADQLSKIRVREDGLIDTASAEISTRLLTLLARVASGTDKDPRAHAIADLIVTLERAGQRQTLGGAWLQRKQSGFLIGIDPAAATDAIQGDVYDGRFLQDRTACLLPADEMSFLLRHARPKGSAWRSIIPERIAHIEACLRTPVSQIAHH